MLGVRRARIQKDSVDDEELGPGACHCAEGFQYFHRVRIGPVVYDPT